jgi:DNA invertase Pin-like site-specific DNA recombinase
VSGVRYVVYLRVSTEQQADAGQGLAIQEEACRQWLRERRHRLVEVCTDAGRSGTLDVGHRPGLTRALALLGAEKADGVLVYRLDRLARDLILQEQVLAELHRRGKELSSCEATEDAHLRHSPDDPTRALVRRILGSVSAYERDVIRLRLMAGRARKALAGGYAGGGPPYGWAAVRGQLVRVPSEQQALKVMRRLRRDGSSYREIVAELDRRGIPSRGGSWHPGTVRDILVRMEKRAEKSPEIEAVSA